MVVFPGLYDYFINPNQSDSYTFHYPCSSPLSCSPIKIRLPPGKFKIECWGAQGGTVKNVGGGKGGYSVGTIELNEYVNAFLNIGAQGYSCNDGDFCVSHNTFNGGGSGQNHYYEEEYRYCASGGGGTDIRFIRNTMNHRVIVAGGGGGSGSGTGQYNLPLYDGAGGGLNGLNGTRSELSSDYREGTGGKQDKAGAAADFPDFGKGSFGYGGDAKTDASGGGGGWFGGGAGKQSACGGGGGSGFVLNESYYSVPSSYAFKNKEFVFTNVELLDGSNSFPSPNSVDQKENGHSGNGAIRITIIEIGDFQKYFCLDHTINGRFSFASHIYVSIILFIKK